MDLGARGRQIAFVKAETIGEGDPTAIPQGHSATETVSVAEEDVDPFGWGFDMSAD